MEAFAAEHYVLAVKLRRDKIRSFDEYPFSLPVVRHLETLELHPAVTFLVGENGSGKSTLMEAVAVAWGFNPEGGTRNFRFGTRASHSVLHEYLRLHEQSHGESFFAVMMHRFGGHGFYVLDEPEAALSPSRQLAMISRIHQLVRSRSQFVIATHSPLLMAYPNSWIYQIDAGGLERVSLQETEHYIVAKHFLNDPQRQLSRLLD